MTELEVPSRSTQWVWRIRSIQERHPMLLFLRNKSLSKVTENMGRVVEFFVGVGNRI